MKQQSLMVMMEQMLGKNITRITGSIEQKIFEFIVDGESVLSIVCFQLFWDGLWLSLLFFGIYSLLLFHRILMMTVMLYSARICINPLFKSITHSIFTYQSSHRQHTGPHSLPRRFQYPYIPVHHLKPPASPLLSLTPSPWTVSHRCFYPRTTSTYATRCCMASWEVTRLATRCTWPPRSYAK